MRGNVKVKLSLDKLHCVPPETPATFICHQCEFIKRRTAPRARDSLYKLGVRDEKHI